MIFLSVKNGRRCETALNETIVATTAALDLISWQLAGSRREASSGP